MIPAVGPQHSTINKQKEFIITPEMEKEFIESHAHVVSGDPISQARYNMDKFQNAISLYPLKGMTGSVNSNFYEFLTMGMVPYLIGSGMMIAIFNAATKYFEPSQQRFASRVGRKMALGVIFYGLLKNISKKFIELPIFLKTGIDINKPYKDMKAQLPENSGMTNNKAKLVEHHKVFESVDFPRWDLLYDIEENKPRNYYYDRIAQRMGLGKDLPDSDQEVKPRIKETVIKTRAWSTISSYLWAGLGVAVAVQDSWNDVFEKKASDTKYLSRKFGREFYKGLKKACRQLWEGGVNKEPIKAGIGKAYTSLTVAATLFGLINASFNFFGKHSDLKDARIDYNKDYTVG